MYDLTKPLMPQLVAGFYKHAKGSEVTLVQALAHSPEIKVGCVGKIIGLRGGGSGAAEYLVKFKGKAWPVSICEANIVAQRAGLQKV